MKWTKAHSQNAVAAKARRRLTMAEAEPEASSRKSYQPRSAAKWRIQVRDLERGDSLTLTLHCLPWPARFVAAQGGEYSAAQIGRGITALLTHAS